MSDARTYQLFDPQSWAMDQARQHHEEALYRVGEYAVFYLLWQPEDHTAGLVDRCPTCFIPLGRTAETFQQPSKARCTDCLGTTFEGGYKARIIRPCVVAYTEEQDVTDRRGTFQRATADIQSTNDFRMRVGDFILRGDGSRWHVTEVGAARLHTGFQVASPEATNIGFAFGRCALIEPPSVAFDAEPTVLSDLVALLDISHPHYPQTFTDFEVIRADLIQHLPAPTPDPPDAIQGQQTWADMLGYTWGEAATTEWGDI